MPWIQLTLFVVVVVVVVVAVVAVVAAVVGGGGGAAAKCMYIGRNIYNYIVIYSNSNLPFSVSVKEQHIRVRLHGQKSEKTTNQTNRNHHFHHLK